MASAAQDPTISQRVQVFRALVPYFGKVLPASFFRKTSTVVSGVERVHNLIEGIYKPVWSPYPLSIASMLKSPYRDQVHFNPDRTWWIQYSPKAGGIDMAVNAGLVRCMADRQPVLVLRQVSNKVSSEGARHRLLGLGFVDGVDHKRFNCFAFAIFDSVLNWCLVHDFF